MSSICTWGSSSSQNEFVFLSDEILPTTLCTTDEILDEPVSDLTSFVKLLQSRLAHPNFLMVAGLFRILRRILKSVNDDSDDLEGKFIHLALSSLLKMPWNKLSTSQALTSDANLGRTGSLDKINCLESHSDLLLGSVVQLFCSLVERTEQDDVGDLTKVFSLYYKFINLVPNLICCFSKHLGSSNKQISGYFRHKVLTLMIRLSYQEQWKSFCPKTWLKLLRQHFEDLLYEPISDYDAGLVNSLDGSPFLPSFSEGNEAHFPCTRNLQRQAIFLLFKCCLALCHASKESDRCQRCECAVETLSSTCELQLCSEDCYQSGLSGLFEWLQRSYPLDKFVDYENYLKSCGSFASSFLQLYAEDDDILLEMLLQLLDAPLFDLQVHNTKERSFEELKSDMHHRLLSIFNPVQLFHLFLQVVHYDHSVLIDYLISKDTGIHCVKYLLRCLRIICDSWLLFVNFSISGTKIDQSCHKRRKMTANTDGTKISSLFCSSSALVKGQHSGKHKSCSLSNRNIQMFTNAKECLLRLKRSLEDLHQKKLFPYNPKPLLRSLARFQELCEKGCLRYE